MAHSPTSPTGAASRVAKLRLPITNILDGWVVNKGKSLNLIVICNDQVRREITIPKTSPDRSNYSVPKEAIGNITVGDIRDGWVLGDKSNLLLIIQDNDGVMREIIMPKSKIT